MIEIPIYNPSGDQTGTTTLDPSLFGGEVRPALLKQAYVRLHANRRSINATTKSRSMVNGSGKKLYKQKGTGNARRGGEIQQVNQHLKLGHEPHLGVYRLKESVHALAGVSAFPACVGKEFHRRDIGVAINNAACHGRPGIGMP